MGIFSFSSIIVTITVILNILLTFLVLLRNPKSATNILFAMLGFTISIWLVVFYISSQPFIAGISLFWIRLSLFFGTLMTSLFFFFSSTIPDDKVTIKKQHFILFLGLTYAIMLLTISPYAFTTVEAINGRPSPVPGPGLIPFIVFSITGNFAAFYVLWNKYKNSVGVVREQIRFVMLGIVLMHGLLIFTILLPTALFKFNNFLSLAPLYTLLFLLLTAYALVKHRLLDIRLVVARSVAYTLLVIILILLYSTVLFVISIYITGVPIRSANLISSLILTLIVAFSVNPLQRVFEKITSRFLYKDMYNPTALLGDISHVIASSLELDDVCRGLFSILSAQMKVTHAIMVLTKDRALITLKRYGSAEEKAYYQKDLLYLLEKTVHQGREKVAVFEELAEGKEKETMRANNITIVIPLKVKHEIVGAIFLGDKASGDIYSSEDINILKIIAPEMAVGVKNALAYDEIKRFNVTLREEVRHATAKLKKANERLKELDELKDEFVSLASHELRTPMTAIKSYIWMAMSQLPKSANPQIHKYLDISYQSAERLIGLVNEMLTVSRIERGSIELNMARTNIKDLMTQVYDELKIRADEQKIAFTINSEISNLFITADKDKLREVFINIIGNALKFTPEEGKITISLKKEDGHVSIAVTDTGPGIAKENLDKLFQKFSKIDYSYSKKQNIHGTGLGLYISKQIISLHHGDINVESQIDVGTSFIVVLPIHQPEKK